MWAELREKLIPVYSAWESESLVEQIEPIADFKSLPDFWEDASYLDGLDELQVDVRQLALFSEYFNRRDYVSEILKLIGEFNPDVLAALRDVFGEQGWAGLDRADAEEYLRGEKFRPLNRAVAHAQLGEMDQAFEWLEKAWALPLYGWEHVPSHPLLDPLRDDPRFEELLRKLNLPEEVIAIHLKANR